VFAGGTSGIWMRTAHDDWQRAALDGVSVAALACSPNYAVDRTVYAATDAGLYVSADGGTTWLPFVEGLDTPESTSLVVHAQDGVWLGTNDGGVYYAPLDTLAWETRNSGLTASCVRALARLKQESTSLFLAGSWGSGVFYSGDDGLSWTAATRNPSNLQIRALASAIGFGSRVVAFAATPEGIYRSVDGGQVWNAAGLASSDVLSIALHPGYATRPNCYVGTAGEGVYYSTNGGLTWLSLNDGLTPSDVYDLAVATSATAPVLYAATNGGVWRYGEPPAIVCYTLPLPLLYK